MTLSTAFIAGFSYDGDGNRVKRISSSGGTIYYIGNLVEWRVAGGTGQGKGTLVKYY